MAVFNVGRGLCVAIVTPNKYLILVDCGHSNNFSPAEFIRRRQIDSLLGANRFAFTLWQGSDIAYFMMTHPHSDHISDIETLYSSLHPSIIIHRPDLDWSRVRRSDRNNPPLDFYLNNFFWPWDYYLPVLSEPVLGTGMTYQFFWLPTDLLSGISNNDSDYVNNSSYVSVIKYAGRTIAITGDMTTTGMDWLLAFNNGLRNAIAKRSDNLPGVDLLICPHHGHPSGFSSRWFEVAGPTKIFNIVSERNARPNENQNQTRVDSRYSDSQYSLAQNDESRRMFSTRTDGHIFILIDDHGRVTYDAFQNIQ